LIDGIDASHEAAKKTGKAFLIAGCFFGAVFLLGKSHVSGWSKWDWNVGFASNAWKWPIGLGLGLFTLSRLAYPIMKPVHIGWMTLAFILGWVNTRLLLGAFFYIILTPIGLVMRLVGKDLLGKKINRSATTYWIKREPEPMDQKRYENLF
jgi:hypothetical protein